MSATINRVALVIFACVTAFPASAQLIQRKDSQQWYINFPSAVAQAMEFTRGEVVEWIVEDKNRLLLRRRKVSAAALKKTKHGKV